MFAASTVPPLINVRDLVYFAASIFWRVSAHEWKLESRQHQVISLGNKYETCKVRASPLPE